MLYPFILKLLFQQPIDYVNLFNALIICTIADFIKRWAPSNENNTLAYILSVCKYLGIPSVFVPDVNDRETMCALAAAISKHENGVDPYMKEVEDGWELL